MVTAVITPEKLDLARLPTPLQPLDRLSEAIGGPRIWIKRDDLTDGIGGGNKIRKLEFVLAEAIALGANVLITSGGLQSNHCRATALVAAQLGLQSHLILRGRPQEFANGNLLLDHLLGAKIHYATGAEFAQLDQTYQKTMAHYIGQGDTPYSIPIGASNALGLWGYIGAARELKADYAAEDIEPSHLFLAVGSGGTFGGLLLGGSLFGLSSVLRGICVSEDAAHFRQKLDCDLDQWRRDYKGSVTPKVDGLLDGYIGAGYGIASRDDFATIEKVARLEGVVLDPVYTAKAFRGMLDQIEKEGITGGDVVFLHTGGVYGLFPQMAHRPLSEFSG